MIDRKIIILSKTIRRVCEKVSADSKFWNFDFYEQKDLNCMCLTASKFLFDCLKDNGFKPSLTTGNFKPLENDKKITNHCWIEVNNYLIDLTATQAKIRKKVLILSLQESLILYTPKKRMKYLYQIRDECKQWPPQQSPFLLNVSYKNYL